MRETSDLYKALRASAGSWYETEILRDGVSYGDNVLHPSERPIKSITYNPALFDDDGPQIGRARSAVCKVLLKESKENWPRMASFKLRMRIHSEDDSQVSEWLDMGVFYTDVRLPDTFGSLAITAYDGIMLLNTAWAGKVSELPTEWPITAKAAALLLQEATGIELVNIDILDNSVPFVGLDTEATARETWMDIAAAHGCNLQMTGDGKLRLVPLTNAPAGGAIAGLAIAGRAVAGDEGSLSGDNYSHYVGFSVSTLDTGEDLQPITGVTLQTESGTKASAGDDQGYRIKGVCNYSDGAVADLCLSRMRGFVYSPFSAADAALDPAAEPGDFVTVAGKIYQVMSIDWTICAKPTADIGADFEEEIDHEFSVLSDSARTLQKAMKATEEAEARAYSALSMSERNILLRVGETYATQQDVDTGLATVESNIELTKNQLSIEINDVNEQAEQRYQEIQYYIRYVNGVIIIGISGDPSTLKISNAGIGMYMNDELTSFWDQNKQRTPKQLEIPVGGSLREGDFIWQPRSSGNLSLMWVGEST